MEQDADEAIRALYRIMELVDKVYWQARETRNMDLANVMREMQIEVHVLRRACFRRLDHWVEENHLRDRVDISDEKKSGRKVGDR